MPSASMVLRTARSHARLSSSVALAFITAGLHAQTTVPPSADPVIVTATRTPQPLSSVLADVSVLDRADIERSGASDVADLLARLPGVAFTRNGGPGGTTSVYLRGSDSRHTAVYLDGVRIDSQATGGALWEQIPLEQIDRIEVLRGPAAAVYGSDAVGGVVQLFTKRARGTAGGGAALQPTASLALGTRSTLRAQAGVSGMADTVDYALAASHGRSRGYSASTTPDANPDADGWRRSAVNAHAGWQATMEHRLDASLLASRLRARFDASPTDDDVSLHFLRTVALGWQGQWSSAATTRAQVSESRNTYESQPFFYRTETTLRNLLLQHEQRIDIHALTATLERREDRLHNPATDFSTDLTGQRAQTGVALGWRVDLGGHALQAQIRRDQDSEFGGHGTGSLAWGWRFMPGWRVTASAATSFRAPTLYQRFGEYGVASLVPEKGRNAEVGLRWAQAGHEAGAVLWRNTVTRLIDFGGPGACASPFGCYENVGRARYEGLTLSGRTSFEGVALRGSIDVQEPRNLDTDKVLARRARHAATVGADTTLVGWTFGTEVQGATSRFDDAANAQRMGGYVLVNLITGTTLAPGLALELRVDNALDQRYELARTYATPRRGAQVMLRWSAK